jgi:REP element-mobilizing transposase RayT
MGRPLRAIAPDALYHAGSRGSNRQPIAFDGTDFESLVREIGKAAAKYEWHVLAWCVMPNHTHLVMSVPKGGFSDGFREINGNHSRRTNRRHGREAHLFKNRPWAIELSTPAHLIGAIAYVLRNPVAAGLVERAEDWPYSSYRASVGLAVPPEWLAIHDLLSLFGHTAADARRNLDALVHRGQLPTESPVSDTDVRT